MRISKMGTFMKGHGRRICSMGKGSNFIKGMVILSRVNSLMEVNSVKEFISLAMDQYMRVTFTTALVKALVNCQ